MSGPRTYSFAPLLVVAMSFACASAPNGGPGTPSEPHRIQVSSPIIARLAGFEPRKGMFDLHIDGESARVYAVFPKPEAPQRAIGEFIYYEGIVTGLGSNPIGLDRGQIGEPKLVRLRELGGRVLIEQLNTNFRALSEDADERRAVDESFASSVLVSLEILARNAEGDLLVDLAPFLLRDAHGIAEQLSDSGQGSFSLEREKSAIDAEATLAFPDNVEFESLLTFQSSRPGELVRGVAAEPRSISFRLHQSLVRLPDDGYRPREFDPRLGSWGIQFADYAAPLDQPIERRWIVRHRLKKSDPALASSPVEKPIVYYVDRGVPEPVRSALVEGAGWWEAAFRAAGFEDAFRVELLPEGAHPLDVRYNVIQWVHRSTRGWSYGGGVVDPRTGEQLKGHVSLGSLRVRQDRLLFEGLLGVAATGSGEENDPVELALARIRQLAAHEVGHALGLAHNFAASTYADRASVMDYPAPLVKIGAQGELDLSRAYGIGVGEWDKHAIRRAYFEFPPGTDETAALEEIARSGLARGFYFLTDQDARSAGAAQPRANLWDNGEEAGAALEQSLRVRRIALAHFGEKNLRSGQPLALLEEVLAPVYFYHRFQVQAAAKVLGGVEYRYSILGDGGLDQARPVPAERQRRALAALLETLQPAALHLPEELLRKLLPRPNGYEPNRELFGRRTGPTFDALGAAATAADLTIRALVQPERAARLVDQHRRSESAPDFSEVLDTLLESTFAETVLLAPREAELARVVQRVVVDRLLELSANENAAPWVRSRVDIALAELLQRVDDSVGLDAGERAHTAAITAEIGRYVARPWSASAAARVAMPEPPGDPIGGAASSRLDPWLDLADDCEFSPQY